jgi:hypothetical protein
MLTASAVDRTNLRIKTVMAIAEKVKAIFTDEQYKKGVDSAKEAIKKASGGKLPDPKKFGDDSMFRYYVENMLMGDLSIELLDKLSK